MSQLRIDLPWHTRRANLLIDTDTLAMLIGRTIHIGPVRVTVHAETKPCDEMDHYHPGLRQALVADCRGGVYGQIESDGQISVGDMVTIAD